MADIVQLPDAKSRPKRRMKPTPIPRRYARKMKAEVVAALHRTNADFEAVFPPAGEKIVLSRQKISKIDTVIALLRRPDGASLDEIVAATGWQRHSVRGALAGAVKKKLGAPVASQLVDGVLRYRAAEARA